MYKHNHISKIDLKDGYETNEHKVKVKSTSSTVMKGNGQAYKLELRVAPNSVLVPTLVGDQRENKIKSVDIFLKTIESTAKRILKTQLQRLKNIRFGLRLYITFVRDVIDDNDDVIGEEKVLKETYDVKYKKLVNISYLDKKYEENISLIHKSVHQIIHAGSKWTVYEVEYATLSVTKYSPLDPGGSWVDLPKIIKNTKTCLNPDNENRLQDRCFELCLLMHSHPVQSKNHLNMKNI